MSAIHARFRLDEDTRVRCHVRKGDTWGTEPGIRVRLSPVMGEPFGSATPSGSIEMIIANPEAVKVFKQAEIGQEFDFIISPVEK